MDEAHRLGFRSLNLDLIYGLPFQTEQSFADTLSQVIELSPARLSVFNYAHMPTRFAPQRRINEADLPSADEKLAILRTTIEMLTQAGYVYWYGSLCSPRGQLGSGTALRYAAAQLPGLLKPFPVRLDWFGGVGYFSGRRRLRTKPLSCPTMKLP